MNEPAIPDSGSPKDDLCVRHVLAVVVAGIALGVGFNALQLSAESSRALPWLRSERRMVSLADFPSTPPSSPAPAARPAAPVPPAAGAPAAGDAARREARPGGSAQPVAVAKPAGPEAATSATAAPVPTTAASTSAAAADVPAIPDSREPVEVGLDVVQKLHAAGAALFLDARSAEEYAEGHVAGAVNLPFDEVFKKPALAKAVDAQGRVLITYCGGGDCDLSRNLAFSLIDAGFRKVLVFTGGIPAWSAAGKAVHKGAQP